MSFFASTGRSIFSVSLPRFLPGVPSGSRHFDPAHIPGSFNIVTLLLRKIPKLVVSWKIPLIPRGSMTLSQKTSYQEVVCSLLLFKLLMSEGCYAGQEPRVLELTG